MYVCAHALLVFIRSELETRNNTVSHFIFNVLMKQTFNANRVFPSNYSKPDFPLHLLAVCKSESHKLNNVISQLFTQ